MAQRSGLSHYRRPTISATFTAYLSVIPETKSVSECRASYELVTELIGNLNALTTCSWSELSLRESQPVDPKLIQQRQKPVQNPVDDVATKDL